MIVAELLAALADAKLSRPLTSQEAGAQVRGIAQDSRQVQQGYVFIARRGAVVDGHHFIPKALEQGASAIIGEGWADAVNLPVPYIQVHDDKIAVAVSASAFYGHPSSQLLSIGITGTDGKTTSSSLLHHILSAAHPTGLLSTAGIKIAQRSLPMQGHFTTPEATEVQRYLAEFVVEGLSHAVIESSSHGFAMHRLDGIAYAMGIVTNLTPEHLDYHKTLEHYRHSKAELVRRAKISILNSDDPHYAYFASQASGEVISYGLAKTASWQGELLEASAAGLRFTVQHESEVHEVFLPMLGTYNIYNALAAMAAAYHCGMTLESIIAALADFRGVAGRMQIVQAEPFAVIVDFAHTPEALAKAIVSVRPQTYGDVIVLTGAAGERDASKREKLGQIAVEYADKTIFTEEDYRSENLESILHALREGARQAGGIETQNFWLIPERTEAIRAAISMTKAGDSVLLCGKGHENTLERGQESIVWDEIGVARAALEHAPHPKG